MQKFSFIQNIVSTVYIFLSLRWLESQIPKARPQNMENGILDKKSHWTQNFCMAVYTQSTYHSHNI